MAKEAAAMGIVHDNFAAIFSILVTVALGSPMPFLPAQLLGVNPANTSPN